MCFRQEVFSQLPRQDSSIQRRQGTALNVQPDGNSAASGFCAAALISLVGGAGVLKTEELS